MVGKPSGMCDDAELVPFRLVLDGGIGMCDEGLVFGRVLDKPRSVFFQKVEGLGKGKKPVFMVCRA